MSYDQYYKDQSVSFPGIITGYQLYRDDVEVFRTSQDLSFVDNNAIQAYRVYSYRIRACNSVGCVESDEVCIVFMNASCYLNRISPQAIYIILLYNF